MALVLINDHQYNLFDIYGSNDNDAPFYKQTK